jgi:hypothetical protein
MTDNGGQWTKEQQTTNNVQQTMRTNNKQQTMDNGQQTTSNSHVS